jgi:hypothetical protein
MPNNKDEQSNMDKSFQKSTGMKVVRQPEVAKGNTDYADKSNPNIKK